MVTLHHAISQKSDFCGKRHSVAQQCHQPLFNQEVDTYKKVTGQMWIHSCEMCSHLSLSLLVTVSFVLCLFYHT